jgi:hypothetical protein
MAEGTGMTAWRLAALGAVLAAGLATALAAPASASRVADACKASGRPNATAGLCNCIQRVANQQLSPGDQRIAARIFRDPHHAQELRQSDNPRDEIFWERWRAFGELASRACG